jgi:hypothetical protein
MQNELNPYQAPEAADSPDVSPDVPKRGLTRFALIGWPAALAANLPAPLMLGLIITERAGRWGMMLAILVFLGLGYLFCYSWPAWSRRFIGVSFLVALTQFVPIFHMLAGAFALAIVEHLPFVGRFDNEGLDDGFHDAINNELGGFVATFIVGSLLCLFVAGLILLFAAIKGGLKRLNNPQPA